MNILLTSVGRRSYMVSYFKKALVGIGEVHASNSHEVYAMKLAHKSVITPLIFDGTYIDFIINYCKKENITGVIPLFDIDIPILAENKNKFTEFGIKLVVSEFSTAKICNDKWLTYKFLTENGFNSPHTFITVEESLKALEIGTLEFPLIIKPRWGMGSLAINQADNIEELRVLYKKCKNDIFNTYLKYESQFDTDRCVIIQQKLQGEEVGLDVLNNFEGQFLTCIPKVKNETFAGETSIAKIISNETLFELGQNLSDKLQHIANLDVDLFKVDQQYYVLELNCRFGGQYPFSHLAGANFPRAIVNMLSGIPVTPDLLHANAGFIGFKDLSPVVLNANND